MTKPNQDDLKQYFDENRAAWIARGLLGQWVLLVAGPKESFHTNYEEVVAAAQALDEDTVLLIQQVLPADPIESIQHVYWDAKA